MVVESYSENNMSASMIGRHLDHYWLGLASLDDLRTNTLESAAGMLVSQYAGSYPQFRFIRCADERILREWIP